ncbi:hypothetical protein BD560DRAFT_163259 [Blakeslea trispora]|nr:hypothetical protein BD560DRAFT_163259 [Blakeslea trispora]
MMKEEEPQFFDLIFNHRENADNNDYYEKTGDFLRVGTAGIFTCSTSGISESIIGIIDSVKKCIVQENGEDVKSVKYTISTYKFEPFNTSVSSVYFDRNSGSGSLFPGWLTTQDNNIVMRRTTIVVQGLATEIELVQRFDMHLSLRFNKPELLLRGDFKMLNVHKFGTLRTILQRYR